MLVDEQAYRSIWQHPEKPGCVQIIDQRQLPFRFVIEDLEHLEHACRAIRDMHVRGAPLIGVTAAWGLYLGIYQLERSGTKPALQHIDDMIQQLLDTRPTAVNLRWAMLAAKQQLEKAEAPFAPLLEQLAKKLTDDDAELCHQIGLQGVSIIEAIAEEKQGEPVNVLTHCNAGWLATVDWGTATSPIYQAQARGIPVHVWVDETRPRNQGASLTAWEMAQQHIPHTVIVDNAGGHLMQQGQVDLVIVGSDRTTRGGDVANKIGTYLKALAARDNDVPFYVALPSSTIDWTLERGVGAIPIEERSPEEVTRVSGTTDSGEITTVQLTPENSPAANPAFDVTPARLVSGLITERGVCDASKSALLALFPEHRDSWQS